MKQCPNCWKALEFWHFFPHFWKLYLDWAIEPLHSYVFYLEFCGSKCHIQLNFVATLTANDEGEHFVFIFVFFSHLIQINRKLNLSLSLSVSEIELLNWNVFPFQNHLIRNTIRFGLTSFSRRRTRREES